MSLTVSRISPETLTAYQVTMANAAAVVELLVELFTLGVQSSAVPVLTDGTPDWQITIRQPGYVDQIANLNDWVVIGSAGPIGHQVIVYTNEAFLAAMTADVAMTWSATATPPVVTAGAAGSATVVVPQPSSPNGPWTYTVTQTNTTTSAVGVATLSGDSSLDPDGNVTFDVTGLVVGDEFTFTVTADTQYSGVAAVSAASVAITATA